MRSFLLGAVALVGAAGLSACSAATPAASSSSPTASPAASPTAVSPTASPTSASPTASPRRSLTPSAVAPSRSDKPVFSDLSALKRLGIDLDEGVLIDVADDGLDRYLQVGKGGVDFTGTAKGDTTMMSLKAAPVRRPNRVLIKPPFWNEDLGAGSCVADTAGAALKLETCAAGRDAQVWEVRPAGDSGQFELYGVHGVIRVDHGKITTAGAGRTGLQTVPFAG